MTDARTLAYINLHAVLGTVPLLCELVPEAKALIEGKRISLGFSVKDGPSGRLVFENGECRFEEGCDPCHIKIAFSKPEKFNGMIDGSVTPIPSRGFTKIGFLLKTFIPLTDLLSRYLRPTAEDLADETFFLTSTRLMFHVIAAAITCIGNEDNVGRASASYITDGAIRLMIGGEDRCYTIAAKDHKLELQKGDATALTSYMQFENIQTARALFDGKINAVAAVGEGKVRVGGMISQVDNANRILDRVALYLA